MSSVFILHHTYGNSESESYKILGVFSTKTKANSEISKYLELPGFKESPNGFTVTEYALDEPHWCGEVTVLTHAKRGMDRLEPL